MYQDIKNEVPVYKNVEFIIAKLCNYIKFKQYYVLYLCCRTRLKTTNKNTILYVRVLIVLVSLMRISLHKQLYFGIS